MPKITKKDLFLADETEKYLPYLNLVMKYMPLKENVKISVREDGQIDLTNSNNTYVLFKNFEDAIDLNTYSEIEEYKDHIVLEEKEVLKKVYSLKKGK